MKRDDHDGYRNTARNRVEGKKPGRGRHIVDYSVFPERFPKSKKMSAALYRIARSFEALGMKEESRNFYQELVDKFPKSAEAKKSKSKVK